MNPSIQSGMHPDAEILTAFAEHLVTDTERQEVLAHMAVCGRCREVVFLAQKAMEAEEPTPILPGFQEPKTGGAWFAGWRWTWIPVTALAGVVGFAVLELYHHASMPETRMAQNVAPPKIANRPEETKAIATSPVPQTPPSPRDESKQRLPAGERSDRDEGFDKRSEDQKEVTDAAQKKDESRRKTDSLYAGSPKVLDGSVHGTMEARAKSSGIGGPMAQNQIQQQNTAQAQQNYADEARQIGTLSNSANKPASSAIQPGMSTQTVTVQAQAGMAPASSTPATAPSVSAMQLESESVLLSGKNLAKLKDGSSPLPSRLGVLSREAIGKRVIAIDTAGSVFVSGDVGKRWQPVIAQWTGRAVLLRTRPAVAATEGPLKEAGLQFELTTDKSEVLVSDDGQRWTLESSATHQ